MSGPRPPSLATTPAFVGRADELAALSRAVESAQADRHFEEALATHRVAGVEAARAKMDMIADELSAALGLGGRARGLTDASERARKAVSQRIHNTVKRLAAVHPEFAQHLERSVRTGRFGSYSPERPTRWSLCPGQSLGASGRTARWLCHVTIHS